MAISYYRNKRKKYKKKVDKAASIAEDFSIKARQLKQLEAQKYKKAKQAQEEIEAAMPEGCFKFIWTLLKNLFKK